MVPASKRIDIGLPTNAAELGVLFRYHDILSGSCLPPLGSNKGQATPTMKHVASVSDDRRHAANLQIMG